MANINLYKLYRGNNSDVKWKGPDGITHSIDVSNPANPPNTWAYTLDLSGKKVMAYKQGAFGEDGELVVSLDGAPSIIATLLHDEDDKPQKYYFATDGGNNNPLKRRAFILRSEGVANSPIAKATSFQVMVVDPNQS